VISDRIVEVMLLEAFSIMHGLIFEPSFFNLI